MIRATAVVGVVGDSRFDGRCIERLPVRWFEASRRRLRRDTDAGTDVVVDLPRGTYLADGVVLDDDGARIVVITRPREPALRVVFDPSLRAGELVERVALVAHAFGNQHVPVDVAGGEILVPITTSEHVARRTLARLGLDGVTAHTCEARIGRYRELTGGHQHTPGAG